MVVSKCIHHQCRVLRILFFVTVRYWLLSLSEWANRNYPQPRTTVHEFLHKAIDRNVSQTRLCITVTVLWGQWLTVCASPSFIFTWKQWVTTVWLYSSSYRKPWRCCRAVAWQTGATWCGPTPGDRATTPSPSSTTRCRITTRLFVRCVCVSVCLCVCAYVYTCTGCPEWDHYTDRLLTYNNMSIYIPYSLVFKCSAFIKRTWLLSPHFLPVFRSRY